MKARIQAIGSRMQNKSNEPLDNPIRLVAFVSSSHTMTTTNKANHSILVNY